MLLTKKLLQKLGFPCCKQREATGKTNTLLHHKPPNSWRTKNTTPFLNYIFPAWCKIAFKRDFLAFGIELSLN